MLAERLAEVVAQAGLVTAHQLGESRLVPGLAAQDQDPFVRTNPGAPTPVFLGSAPGSNDPGTCTSGAALANPTLCHPCTQVQSCLNACNLGTRC